MPARLNSELNRFRRLMVGWRLQLLLLRGGACLVATVAMLGLLDVVLKAGRAGRWSGFVVLLAMGATLALYAARVLRRRLTPEGLAAVIERTYPELDNRLINYVQFEGASDGNPLKAAYLDSGAPALDKLEVRRMKDRRAWLRGTLAMLAALVLLITPFFIFGSHWTRALLRTINPVSAMEPATLTRILAIEPENADILQGASCLLVSRVQGMRGHTVRVDVVPDDARQTTYELGKIEAEAPQAFAHRIPRVNTRFRYRFRAGDAVPSAWYTVTPRPPPALTALGAVLTPPAYTRLPGREVDLRADGVLSIPDGALLRLRAVSATPLETLTATVAGGDPVAMRFDPQQNCWDATLTVTAPGAISIEGVDAYQQKLRESAAYLFAADQPPVIEILAPQGRVALPAGEVPLIEFRVQDDYGLTAVSIERVDKAGARNGADGALERWDPQGSAMFGTRWSGTVEPRQTAAAYRITAIDNAPGEGRITRSATVVFDMPTAARQAETRDNLEEAAAAGLQQVIALQEQNLEQCRALRPGAESGAPALWLEPAERQAEVRRLTRALLQNPLRPLGGRTESVSRLYANEMTLVIDAIGRIGALPAAQRDRQINETLTLQASILRQLKASEVAAERAQVGRRQSGISAMLAALIAGQAKILEQLGADGGGAGVGAAVLVDRQDALAEDVGAFEAACGRDAASVRGNDAAFADLLETVGRETRERRIREDMLQAAERIEQQQSAEAVTLGVRAHGHLVHLQELLDRVGLQREQEVKMSMAEAVGQAKEKMRRIEDMHQVMQQAMDTVRGHTDKDSEAFDVMADEFVEILKKNTAALLQIPVDLHVFTDLNVGNELVEDVFAVFQEVEQAAGSEKMKAEDVVELAYAKNLDAMEAMREAMDRLDDVEMWLTDKPEMDKVLTEALDREEMPEAGIALGALAAQVEDLIGELKDESEEQAAAADDGATTHAMPDMVMGWDVLEGDIASFAAKGKSGNDRPDHKEQDGRSNVGREGMASGETAAGSGTIGEGDKDIEERRTEDPAQSGMVQLDGEASTVATGGGKLGSGKADGVGMEGGVKRMDSTEEGSWEGMAALLAKDADAVFAKASLKNVRVDSLKTAAHHLRQADDAIAKGDIGRIAEHRKLAVAALQRAKIELAAAPSGAIQLDAAPSLIEDAVQAGADLAPPKYQSQVADYYKLLNEEF